MSGVLRLYPEINQSDYSFQTTRHIQTNQITAFKSRGKNKAIRLQHSNHVEKTKQSDYSIQTTWKKTKQSDYSIQTTWKKQSNQITAFKPRGKNKAIRLQHSNHVEKNKAIRLQHSNHMTQTYQSDNSIQTT